MQPQAIQPQPLQQAPGYPPGLPRGPVFQPMMVMMYAPPGSSGSNGYPPPGFMPPMQQGQQLQQQPWQPYPPSFPGMTMPQQQPPPPPPPPPQHAQQQQQQNPIQQRQVTFDRQASALSVPHNPALAGRSDNDDDGDGDNQSGSLSPTYTAAARRGSSTLSPRRVAGSGGGGGGGGGDGVMVVKTIDASQLPSLPDFTPLTSKERLRRPTLFLSEVELIGQRRRERDRTMFLLWLLGSLMLLSLCFHLHRGPWDRHFYPRFGWACLALGVAGGLALVLAIALIFLGRHLRDPTAALVLLHSFLAWLASFVMYLPLLVKYVPSAADLLASTPSSTSAGSSSANGILAALVLHALSLALFYPLLVSIVAGGGGGGSSSASSSSSESASAAVRSELHGALEALSSTQRDQRALHEAFEALQKRLAATQDEARAATTSHKRALLDAQQRVQQAGEEVAQLQAILDGLDGSKALDSRAGSLASETLVHVRRNHAFELRKLLDEADARAKVGLALSRELDLAKTELASERSRAQALRAELDILTLQMSNAGLERSRVLDLTQRLQDLTKEQRDQSLELSRAHAQLLLAKQGKCIHCEEWRERYEQLRDHQLAAAKVREENSSLQMQLGDLQQQLSEAQRDQRRAEARTRRKLDRINADLEDFETFTQHMEPEQPDTTQ